MRLPAPARFQSSNKRMEERIRHMAYYDEMTGLPIRRLFVSYLNEAMVTAQENKAS